MNFLTQSYITLYQSPQPERIHAHSPGIARLPSVRLVAVLGLNGPGVASLAGEKWLQGERNFASQGSTYRMPDFRNLVY